jgi:hypothetical protein
MTETAELLIVSAEELCEHWGLTDRRLRELAKDGIAVKVRGGFDLRESDKRYISRLRSHDESRRLKAQLLARQTQRHEIRLHQDAAQLLTRTEAIGQAEAWWGRAWDAAGGAISRLYYGLPGTDAERRAICWGVYNDLRGELLVHRETIKDAFLAPAVPRTLDQHLQRLGINSDEPADE